MSIELLTSVLGWCTVINLGILLWWFGFMLFAHDFIYKFHTKWFPMPVEKFNEIHYMAMAFYKLTVFVFNFAPYLALKIVF